MTSVNAYGYFLVSAGLPLERRNFELTAPEVDQVTVKVAGCGLCHTDISFLSGSVATKQALPLVLGHEISGEVVALGGQVPFHWLGKKVIIPAVLPCGECELCQSGRDNVCQQQKMPGNDFNGGFASHIKVPFRFLCPLPEDLGAFNLAELSVVADAVTTPFQSLKRSKLTSGDLAIVIGVGGIGLYMVQHANNAGAKVIALDIDESRLLEAKKQGASYTIMVKGMAENDIKSAIRALVKELKLPKYQWKIFETSGTTAGQQAAYSLLTYGATLGIVGFTMDKLSIRLSNLMAFDADVFGNWGCRPVYYTEVAAAVLSGKIQLKSNIQEYPLDQINEVIQLALEHKLQKRAIFIP